MRWIIDGHNLIPKVPGMHLSNMDDEQALIAWLQEAARVMQDSIDVYFDQAPPGYPVRRGYGRVTAFFIRKGTTVDQAIWSRLENDGVRSKEYSVVSSDHLVQQGARKMHARAFRSEDFVSLVAEKLATRQMKRQTDPLINESEIEEWLRLFGEDSHKK